MRGILASVVVLLVGWFVVFIRVTFSPVFVCFGLGWIRIKIKTWMMEEMRERETKF